MIHLRPAVGRECPALTELCLRSKAHWGYDAAFLAACREELTLRPAEIETTRLAVAEREGAVVGLVQVARKAEDADLLKLFVAPEAMGAGVGRALFDWAVAAARDLGAARLLIEADPDAAPFYERLGARRIGMAPSGSIPGRVLPFLEKTLS